MTKYNIRFKLSDGTMIYWTRFGKSMEECLTLTKQTVSKEYGEKWNGNIEICGPQGDSGVYDF